MENGVRTRVKFCKVRFSALLIADSLSWLPTRTLPWRRAMVNLAPEPLMDDRGQDIAEYAVMLAVILVLVIGTIRLIGTNANTVFSNVASSIQ